jgi:malonyl-CoA O-methyltransferase
MDMERITLSYSSPESLIAELRGLGRNLHPDRFPGLRGRQWRKDLGEAMGRELSSPDEDGRLKLTFEIIYGHAFKPQARLPVQAQTAISLDEMRKALRQGKP